jgi:hypothetical protein
LENSNNNNKKASVREYKGVQDVVTHFQLSLFRMITHISAGSVRPASDTEGRSILATAILWFSVSCAMMMKALG